MTITASDILKILPKLTPDQRAKVDDIVRSTGKIWVAQGGPQTVALESKADILFYGGSAGGGKTDLLLGAALTEQEHSIIFRREAVQLIGLEERMAKILPTGRKGYNSQSGVWRLPGGKVMELGSVKEPEDWIKYQGRAHDCKCVGAGTMILMADGQYRAIETLIVGDVVATLEGPRAVTRTFKMRKAAVLVSAVSDGVTLASQVQSASHRLLVPDGWASQDTLISLDAFSPNQRRSAYKCEELSSRTYSPFSSTHVDQSQDLVQLQEQARDHAGYQSLSGFCVGVASSVLESDSLASACQPSATAQHSLATGLQALQQPYRVLSAPGSLQQPSLHGATDVQPETSHGDSRADCSSGPRLHGEQPRRAPVACQGLIHLPVGAGQRSPTGFAGDDQGRTPTHSLHTKSYFHPYTKEIRQIQAELLEVSFEFDELGERDLFDITVDEVNHYQSLGGFVNCNCFDEITHFTESQFRTLIGWMRSDNPKVRQRVICAGNPPTSSEGEWVIRYWAPWLDPQHPNPAKPCELRWYVSDEKGEDMEVPGPEPVLIGGEYVKPKSRTFVASSVDDNLFLLTTGYKATLQSLPEPLRSQMLRGDFQAGRADPVWQLVPTEWVKAAQARWTKKDAKGEMTSLGFDVARGGVDKSTAARRHGQWFDELVTAPGVVTNDGPKAAGFIAPLIRNGAPICIDAIGIGTSALDFIRGLNLLVVPVVGSEKSLSTDKTGNLRFRNKRAEMYWRLREALDPTSPDPVALPPDTELLGDICAVRYKVVTLGALAAIQIRDKDEIREALGRSPDKGDAVAMTFVDGIPPAGTKEEATAFRGRQRYN